MPHDIMDVDRVDIIQKSPVLNRYYMGEEEARRAAAHEKPLVYSLHFSCETMRLRSSTRLVEVSSEKVVSR